MSALDARPDRPVAVPGHVAVITGAASVIGGALADRPVRPG